MTRLRWGVPLCAAVVSSGCFTEPAQDERFSILAESERVPYARARVERANQAIAGGATMVVLGLAALGTGIYLAVKDRSGDCVGCGDGRTLALAYAAGGLIGAGIPTATKGFRCRALWKEFAEPREAARNRAGVRTANRSRGTLYLPAGEPVPAEAAGVEVVRVASPSDPEARRLASRVPALRWPVLESPAPGGGARISAGPVSVRETLAGSSPEVLD
ncbi:MAG: hypothetical protein L0216_14840 [Planctomycetales bacterium]|nr:hypothetical protein [Planctomycetales bacterium]